MLANQTNESWNEYQREWRKNNPDKVASYRKPPKPGQKSKWGKAHYQRKKDFINAEKEKRGGCVMCPEATLVCLDFHHRDPEIKNEKLRYSTKKRSPGLFRLTWPELEEELAKCDLLCANCHRKAHADEVVMSNAL